jgi:hypothetical protein
LESGLLTALPSSLANFFEQFALARGQASQGLDDYLD